MISPNSPFRIPLQDEDISPDLFQRAQGLGFVEVSGEADLVADFDTVGCVPGVGGVGENFTSQESLRFRPLPAGVFARCPGGRGPARIQRLRPCLRSQSGYRPRGGIWLNCSHPVHFLDYGLGGLCL